MQRDKRSRAHHRIDLTLNTVAYQMKTIRETQFLKIIEAKVVQAGG